LKENEGKFSDDMKQTVRNAVQEAKKHLDSQDVNEIQQATETLTRTSQQMSEQLYQSSQKQETPQQPQGEQKPQEGKKPDDVIDADYKEVG
jgi:molecular chaperone DnaK